MLVGMSLSKPATQTVIAQQAEVLAGLPFTDTQDFEDANRGLVALDRGSGVGRGRHRGVGQLDLRLPAG